METTQKFAMIEVKNISFRYTSAKWVFQDVNFEHAPGEILSILGANGAGKSTILNCLAGLFKPNSGDITMDGESIYSMNRTDIAKLIGYVPQIHDSTFDFTLLEYAVMGRAPYFHLYETPKEKDYEIARKNLELVGLGGMEDRVFTEISGGEQQLATIARTLTQEPKVILLDEPTNHLDYGNQHRMLMTIKELASNGYAVIITTHNPDHALQLDGKVAILNKAGKLLVGNAKEVLKEEILSEIYGIDVSLIYEEAVGRTICLAK